VSLHAEPLEAAGEQIAVLVQQIFTQLIGDDQDDKLRFPGRRRFDDRFRIPNTGDGCNTASEKN
jgi:hypothetical protein